MQVSHFTREKLTFQVFIQCVLLHIQKDHKELKTGTQVNDLTGPLLHGIQQ